MTNATAWGIETEHRDYRGELRRPPQSTIDAVLDAMGAGDEVPPAVPGLRIVREGSCEPLGGVWELRTEDGGSQRVVGALPPDVPPGYHVLESDEGEVRLIVSPGRCAPAPADPTWGWAVQLYATRSRESWGIGDLADLRRLGGWATGTGAGMLLVNPLHASLPTIPTDSPYFPSSRCFRNPIYLRVGGAEAKAAQARALNADRRIDRGAVWRHKSEALEEQWRAFGGDPDFDRYRAELGDALSGYAVFCAISEEHGVPWSRWPVGLRHPDAPAVARFAKERADRVRHHEWLQWLLDTQLAESGAAIPLVQDLAIGCDPAGADAWLWQDAFALDVRVGAPPDEFNTKGQDWGLPPFDPWRLRAGNYEPFVQTVRAGLRHAGGLRVDHVMGLFRLYWIPEGAGPAEGAYVRYPWADLLDILALESQRAGAYVVGEDLGTVEHYMREELAGRGVLSYRLLWFEPEPPRTFPANALAAVTTHDLPTVAGLWTGADLAEQEALGLEPNVESTEAIRTRLREWARLDADAPVPEVVRAAYRLLGEAPSAVVAATLDDALGVEERPNVPGTTEERPNWSLALPLPLEHVERHEGVLGVARLLAERRPRPAAGHGDGDSREEEAC